MEMKYVKELDRVYLVPELSQIDEDEYVLQVALRGRLPGILPLGIARTDGKMTLRADVTACTSIASRYKQTSLAGNELRKLLVSIRDTASRMPALLMSVRDLYLDPDCIFLGPGGDEVLLCYIPHISQQEADSVRLLSEFLLKKADHSDQAATTLAYSLYDQVSADSYDLSYLLSKLFSEEEMPALGSGRSGQASAGGPPGSSFPDSFAAGSTPQPSGRPVCASSGPEYAKDSRSLVRKLPPPDRKKGRKKRRKASAARHGKMKKASISGKQLLPAAILLPAAGAAAFFFRMDLTQICGMGFLCASLIWIIHSSMEKHSNETRNRWFEEDEMAGDDQFYQELRKELYQEEPLFGGSEAPAGGRWEAQRSGGSEAPMPGRRETSLYGGQERTLPGSYEEQTRCLRPQNPVLVSLRKDLCTDIPLSQDHLILGKSRAQADVILPGDTVSRKHARIERRMDGYYVTDLFSTNGTFLDGHRLESGQAVALKNNAQLTIASLPYRVAIPSNQQAV